jgi:hypothetical protein
LGVLSQKVLPSITIIASACGTVKGPNVHFNEKANASEEIAMYER